MSGYAFLGGLLLLGVHQPFLAFGVWVAGLAFAAMNDL